MIKKPAVKSKSFLIKKCFLFQKKCFNREKLWRALIEKHWYLRTIFSFEISTHTDEHMQDE